MNKSDNTPFKSGGFNENNNKQLLRQIKRIGTQNIKPCSKRSYHQKMKTSITFYNLKFKCPRKL